MTLKLIVGLALGIFGSMAGMILFVGLVLTPQKPVAQLGQNTAGSPGIYNDQPASGLDGSPQSPSPSSTPGGEPSPGTTPNPATPKTSVPSPTPAGAKTPTPTPVKTATPAPTPVPTSSPTPAPIACGSPGGACTAAQVATHNSAGNCWVIYNGWYHIVTGFVNSHPGGTSVFNSSTCGQNIAAYLSGSASTAGKQNNHTQSAYTILNSYKVGPVQ